MKIKKKINHVLFVVISLFILFVIGLGLYLKITLKPTNNDLLVSSKGTLIATSGSTPPKKTVSSKTKTSVSHLSNEDIILHKVMTQTQEVSVPSQSEESSSRSQAEVSTNQMSSSQSRTTEPSNEEQEKKNEATAEQLKKEYEAKGYNVTIVHQ